LWPGLLTRPLPLTAGLLGLPSPETFGHAGWPGQETGPQRALYCNWCADPYVYIALPLADGPWMQQRRAGARESRLSHRRGLR